MGDDAPSYEEWERYCFTQGQADFADSVEFEDDAIDSRRERFTVLDESIVIAYLSRLFSDPRPLADRYTLDQLADGVWFVFGSASEFLVPYLDDATPATELVRRLRLVGDVYEKLFDGLLASTNARDPDGQRELAGAVFMIWDMDNDLGRYLCLGDAAVVDAAYELIDRILACESTACHKSALHALDHAAWSQHRLRVVERIDGYLSRPGLPAEIIEYATRSRAGQNQ
ncbi:MAG: hypothetical protein AAFY58_00115 [Planctomycetota bacterium]